MVFNQIEKARDKKKTLLGMGVGKLVVLPINMENRELIEYSNKFFNIEHQILPIHIMNPLLTYHPFNNQ